MTDPAGQYDPSAQQPTYGAQQPAYGTPQPSYGAPPPGARYVPPTLDEIWYKTTPNILLAVITCGMWCAAWTFRTHDDLQKHNGEGIGGAIALLLALFVGVVIWFTVPMEIEKSYARNGWPSPVKATDGLWMLVPFAGPFIWYPKMQAALNSYWLSQGSRPAAA